MRVGVVDLGGNTARLLVARSSGNGLERITEERALLGLGAEIESSGIISTPKLEEAAATVARLLSLAHEAGAERVEVLVTSPGRQSTNRKALERSLTRVAAGRLRFLTAEEEGRLAYIGALACTPLESDRFAVCDVGGGSAEIAVGSREGGPVWIRSVDLGSLRLTCRYFRQSPPSRPELKAARVAVRAAFTPLAPPAPDTGLAAGGTARALRKLVGPRLGADELAAALEIVTKAKPRKLAQRFGVVGWRAALLPAGVLMLSEIQRLLDTPLVVAAGGVREGATLELIRQTAAAA